MLRQRIRRLLLRYGPTLTLYLKSSRRNSHHRCSKKQALHARSKHSFGEYLILPSNCYFCLTGGLTIKTMAILRALVGEQDVPMVNGKFGTKYNDAWLNRTATSQKFKLPPRPATLTGSDTEPRGHMITTACWRYASEEECDTLTGMIARAQQSIVSLFAMRIPEQALLQQPMMAAGLGSHKTNVPHAGAANPAPAAAPSAAPEGARTEAAAAPAPAPAGAKTEAVGGFVTTKGTNFVLNGEILKLSGSNDYFLIFRWAPA